jgi:hypothetical protein
MPEKSKDYNQLELETISELRAEGRDSFEEMAGPLRRRMAEKMGKTNRQTPLLVRFSVVMAALSIVVLLIMVTMTT